MSNDIISTLYDHYKDTCSIIAEAIKRRDRLMLFVILALGFFAFDTVLPDASNIAVNERLNFKFGLNLNLNLAVVANVVWFLLLVFTLRYFQVAVFVERQYGYLHGIEEKLNKKAETELITREGKSYLNKYPLFSNWMWLLYTIIFPLFLLIVSGIKIWNELKYVYIDGWTGSLLLDSVVFVILVISVGLYLTTIHKKPKDK